MHTIIYETHKNHESLRNKKEGNPFFAWRNMKRSPHVKYSYGDDGVHHLRKTS